MLVGSRGCTTGRHLPLFNIFNLFAGWFYRAHPYIVLLLMLGSIYIFCLLPQPVLLHVDRRAVLEKSARPVSTVRALLDTLDQRDFIQGMRFVCFILFGRSRNFIGPDKEHLVECNVGYGFDQVKPMLTRLNTQLR